MKFSTEKSNMNSVQRSWQQDHRKPKVLVNNFMSDETDDKQKSKSVIISAVQVDMHSKTDTGLPPVVRGNDINTNRPSTIGSDNNGNRMRYRTSSTSKLEFVQPRRSSVTSKRNTFKSQDSFSSARVSEERYRSQSLSSDSADDSRPSALVCQNQRRAWNVFENHVKSIDDSSEYFTRKPKVSFNSSDTFQKVMVDLYGNTEYGRKNESTKHQPKVGNFTLIASRLITRRRTRKTITEENENVRSVNGKANRQSESNKSTVSNARRGWRILRRHVWDSINEKKGSAASLNWAMLKQTVRGMTDMERARLDLYKRYGIIPTLKSDGTTVQENTMLSERARSLSVSSLTALTIPKIRRAHLSIRPASWQIEDRSKKRH